MKIDSKSTFKTAALITALGVIGTAAWGFGDYTGLRPIIKKEYDVAQQQTQLDQQMLQQQIENNQQVVLVLQFDQLEQKRKFGFLSFDEIQKRCKIAEALKYVLVDGCGK